MTKLPNTFLLILLPNFRSSFELRKKENIRKNDLIDIMLDALKDFQVTFYNTSLTLIINLLSWYLLISYINL